MDTESIGPQERKRSAKAMPPRQQTPSPGCLWAMFIYLVLCGLALWFTREWFLVALILPAAIALFTWIGEQLRGWALLLECRKILAPRGVRFLVVYSDSPVWKEHVRDEWLPRFGSAAVLLNWTERARWDRRSLEVRLFNQFIKDQTNFNPAVLVLQDLGRPLVYRFYYSFQQAKHGRSQYLNELETELFQHIPQLM